MGHGGCRRGGAKHVLEILRHELHMAMTLAGRPDLATIDRSLIKS